MTATETALNGKVHDLLLDQIKRGTQLGTQVCAYKDGEMIVHTWAGEVGPRDPRPVQADTLFSSFSTTKGPAALALHILADRGIIDYQAPVARYWPEFAANGKGSVTVAQAMSHQAGLHAAPPTDVALDWDRALDFIATGVPAYEPGTSTGYHALTFGWVVGGIVEKATGRHFKDVIQEEIARPLDIEGEMYIGIPDGLDERLARLEGAARPTSEQIAASPTANLPHDHDHYKAIPTSFDLNFNKMEVRKACIPSANGHFTARALAKTYAALANKGEVGGTRIVSSETVRLMSTIQVDTPDRVTLTQIRKSMGFFNGGKTKGAHGATGPRETAFGHAGGGGSIAFADPDVNLSVAVTINKLMSGLQAEGPAFEICELIRNELGVNG